MAIMATVYTLVADQSTSSLSYAHHVNVNDVSRHDSESTKQATSTPTQGQVYLISRIFFACGLQNKPLWVSSLPGLLHPIARQIVDAGSTLSICAEVVKGLPNGDSVSKTCLWVREYNQHSKVEWW